MILIRSLSSSAAGQLIYLLFVLIPYVKLEEKDGWRLWPSLNEFFGASLCRPAQIPGASLVPDIKLTREPYVLPDGRQAFHERLEVTEESLQYGLCRNSEDCKAVGGLAQGACPSNGEICCVSMVQCGQSTRLLNASIANYAYPDTRKKPGNCSLRIDQSTNTIQTLKITLKHFDLHPPSSSGECEVDSFRVENAISPLMGQKMCGQANGAHMYVRFGASEKFITLLVHTTGNAYNRKWMFHIEQLKNAPPAYCDQVYSVEQMTSKPVLLHSLPNLISKKQSAIIYHACVQASVNTGRLLLLPSTQSTISTENAVKEASQSPSSCDLNSSYINVTDTNGEKIYCGERLKKAILLIQKPFHIGFYHKKTPLNVVYSLVPLPLKKTL